jgi:hypothetical protein
VSPPPRSWYYFGTATLGWEIPEVNGFGATDTTIQLAVFPEWMVPTADAGVIGFASTVRTSLEGPSGPQFVRLLRVFRSLFDYELRSFIGRPVFLWQNPYFL